MESYQSFDLNNSERGSNLLCRCHLKKGSCHRCW
ncbi:unnamed protein product [Prunus brigantina]